MTRPPILMEVVVAIRGGPLDPEKAWLPQKGLRGDGVGAFAGGNRTNNGQHLELPWHLGEGTYGEFLVHIISREARE